MRDFVSNYIDQSDMIEEASTWGSYQAMSVSSWITSQKGHPFLLARKEVLQGLSFR
jgi:hypothetical protein